MNCEEVEKEIYLYRELTDAERKLVDTHIQTCTACKELFQVVLSTQTLIEKASIIKPELSNHGRLTSNIMQAVAKQQTKSASWINSLFLKYVMVAASVALVIAFGVEQLSPVDGPYKRMPVARTVTLNSASFMKAALERKEKPDTNKPSLYACFKSGDCNNTLLENFKQKKSL
jgi:predicted anti-sigma-YlaC factor YlaD